MKFKNQIFLGQFTNPLQHCRHVKYARRIFDEGTCGAVTGALRANGILNDDPSQIKANAKEIFNTFKEEYGTVRCDRISDCGNDKSPCVDCCVFIAKKVADLLDE